MKRSLSLTGRIFIFNRFLPGLLCIGSVAVLYNIEYNSLDAEGLKEQELQGNLIKADLQKQLKSKYQSLKSTGNLPTARIVFKEIPDFLDWSEYQTNEKFVRCIAC